MTGLDTTGPIVTTIYDLHYMNHFIATGEDAIFNPETVPLP